MPPLTNKHIKQIEAWEKQGLNYDQIHFNCLFFKYRAEQEKDWHDCYFFQWLLDCWVYPKIPKHRY